MPTNNPGGITSYGMPVFGQPFLTTYGRPWFVDGNTGSNRQTGKTRDDPFRTMAQAFASVGSGDVIFFRGNIREQLSTPVGVFDVTIMGGGNQPRHADAHTGNNGYSSATWKLPASPTAATPLLTIRQQGWRLFNILFDGPSDASSVQLFRDGGADDAERDASHAHIAGCKFVAAQNHIEFKGGLSQCVIEGNLFFGATADSILETVGAGIGTNNYHRFIGNHFHNNASHIDVGLNYASILGNTFGKFTTAGIDLRGGSENVVGGLNSLYGTYSEAGGYFSSGATDQWNGNTANVTGGITDARPA